MRKLTLLVCLFGISWPALAAKPISVGQLEQWLTAEQGKHDGQIAQSLSQLALTQRFSSVRLTHWLAQLPGQKSKQALIQLTDLSAFLDLPPEDIPPRAVPSVTEQTHMVDLSINYIKQTIHQLPNLFATRVTTSFQEVQHGKGGAVGDTGLYVAGRYSANIIYHDGGEQATPPPGKHAQSPAGLVTSGEFGLLGTVLEDAVNSSLSWSHWEQGTQGVAAVYRYSVPADKSHYQVGSSWLQDRGKHRVVVQRFSAYTGEIALDPSNGTIVRLLMKAIPRPDDPLIKADILVEYGPVVMDGKTYICPVRSVALSIAPPFDDLKQSVSDTGPQFQLTSLNHVTFEQYHLFHAEVRILNGYSVPDAAAH